MFGEIDIWLSLRMIRSCLQDDGMLLRASQMMPQPRDPSPMTAMDRPFSFFSIFASAAPNACETATPAWPA